MEGDSGTDCIFVECPFRNPTEYLKRYGFTYIPEISRCYIPNRETNPKAKPGQKQNEVELLEAIIEGLKALEEMAANRKQIQK